MFAIVTVLAILGLWLGLAFRRFGARAAERPAEGTNEPGPGGFSRWFFRRVAESLRKPGRDALADRLRSPALRRAPVIERGLFGITLLLHFTAGVVFAVCLALTAILKAGRYIPNPGPLSLPAFSGDLPSGRGIGKVTKVSIPDRDIISGLFWVFVLAGFSLTVSAFLPMLPWFHHQGQVILFAWHRWSALAALLAAIAFADLEFFPRRPAA
jgi:hypothetical protein